MVQLNRELNQEWKQHINRKTFCDAFPNHFVGILLFLFEFIYSLHSLE